MIASNVQATSKQADPVLYARVPESLKATTESHATEHGLTLAAAVIELLERGLEVGDSSEVVAELEDRARELTADKVTLQSELQGARSELQALGALGSRVGQPVGSCPNSECVASITGYDLLVTGSCPSCGARLSGLLIGKSERQEGLNQQEFLLLIGALGALVGVALLAAKNA